ncbi:MAG TPA: hypothetical protein VL358_01745 [Caulobacteraceae bacterium]|jgi:hypothetical protein|nr:hypothetical protein [Caulobacteraceae bacterium]
MRQQYRRLALVALMAGATMSALPAAAAEKSNPPPTQKDWLALSRLPDWSGVWNPDITDQNRQATANPPPWTPAVAKQIEHMTAEEKAGRPRLILMGCLPYGMPNLMTITHNAMEILFTPGRVTILGESDGNRLRRIYTDGRDHPEDPDLSFHGHSVGHWEGQTLVVDTVGILPQVWLATGEGVGIPNNGDMHVVERIHLAAPDVLVDDLTVTAPKVLTSPWKTTRKFYRQRAQKFDIVEGACEQGNFKAATDAQGNSIYVPIELDPLGGVSSKR